MAGLAGCRETGGRMVRIGRGLVIRLVAGIAVGRNRCVVIVHVAIGASHGGVGPGEREGGVVVIERRRLPGGGVMAELALLREA